MPIFDSTKSKIKMVGLTGPKEKNITWYSIVSQNKKPIPKIIEGMLFRFKTNPAYNSCKVIQFYDTETNQLVYEVR
jgi:hypothetical protein